MFRAFFIRIFFRMIALFPLSIAHRLGRLLGWFFSSYSNELSRITRRNIDLCFPEMDLTQRNELIRESLMQTGMAALECGPMWLWPKERILKHVRKVVGWELVDKARDEGKGIIMLTPHIGSWEMVGLEFSMRMPMMCLYRPPRLRGLDALIRKARERVGSILVPTDASGVRALYKVLSQGGMVGILPDQDPGRGAGVFAPFFGIQANTMTLVPRLAAKTNSVVLMVYAQRLPHGQGYNIYISTTPSCLADKDQIKAASCLNSAIEECIRKLPAQYQWAYRRFKNRPENGGKLYGREPLVNNSDVRLI